MPQINSELFHRLEQRLHLSRSRLYALIDETARSTHLPRRLAAIVFASDSGINTSRYATDEDLAEIRNAVRGSAPPSIPHPVRSAPIRAKKSGRQKKVAKKQSTTVFVVHGRDLKRRDAMFTFLNAIGVKPLEWSQAIRLTKQASPYVGTVLETAFEHAAAIVVLLTPDDKVRLKKEFQSTSDPAFEKIFSAQARPNVLFEAGMAFGTNSRSTVLVEVGKLKPFSDVYGRHVVHITNEVKKRKELADRLQIAGCDIDLTGDHWITAGDFS